MKKGYIFVETIAVLVVVTIAVSMLLVNYTLIMKRTTIKEYYNRPNDIYALYTVMNYGTNENKNYISRGQTSWWTSRSTCDSSALKDYMPDNCETVLKDMNIINIGIINDIENIDYSKYDNGTINYLEYLADKEVDNEKIYAVAVFYIDSEYYYSSIVLE